ncbi:MAG: phage integrase SAM-like domain-containing protein, partial [Ferruginibacter sp.]|nr:phage integrase SAM-like domain-containing protein [Ferruginibacter sp.]
MSRTFDYLFYPKKPKNYKSGPVTLYIRITVEGDRKEAATSLEIVPDNWESGKMKGHKEEAKTFNTSVSNLVTELYKCYNKLLQNDQDITAESLRNAFTGKGERTRYFIDIFKEHNKGIEKLIGKDYEKPTLTKYNTTLDHLTSFLKWKFNLTDVALGRLDHEFITDFEFYLKTEKNIGHNTTAKYVSNTRKVVNECVDKKWLKTDPFSNYSITAEIVDPVFLTEEELNLIITKEFKIQRLAQVRDIFVFSCYTGFAFIEVFNLTPGHVTIGIDKEKWIFTERQKNNNASHVPLLDPALAIIEKYKNHP